MKFRFQIRLLLFSVLAGASIALVIFFLKVQYTERIDFLTELLFQRGRAVGRIVLDYPMDQAMRKIDGETRTPDWAKSYVIDSSRNILSAVTDDERKLIAEILQHENFKASLETKASETILDLPLESHRYYVGYKILGSVKKIVLTIVPHSIVISLMWFQIFLSVCLMLLVLGTALAASDRVVNRLAGDLNSLVSGMEKFGAGNMETQLTFQTHSVETSSLVNHFNTMANRVRELVKVSQEKGQIDAELTTARRVQSTLFPPLILDQQGFEIRSLFETALDCGGDWFHYYVKNDFLWIGIGDVTGHGLPSALMTSASRAAFSVFEEEPSRDPSEILGHLNKVIFKTTNGSLQMTFFLIRIDLCTGSAVYSNASHEPCFHIDSEGSANLLHETSGPRLGQTLDSSYVSHTVEFKRNDNLFLYTDGIYEIGSLNDRRLQKLLKEFIKAENLHETNNSMTKKIWELRKGEKLKDDLSWIFLRFQGYDGPAEA
jgi:sigma-B regulation protein RsbU (phosphoserine phosphatase)